MDITQAIRSRKSIRGYLPTPVPKEVLAQILELATRAPSSMNTQPWSFNILGGKALNALRNSFKAEFIKGREGKPDIPASVFTGAHRTRQVEVAKDLFQLMNIAREDKEKRQQWLLNMICFFDAPNAIIIYTDDSSPTVMGAVGIVSQTICLTALAHGLGTCIMGQPVLWPEIYREIIGIPAGKPIATSIAIGYPDLDAPINNFPRPREPLDTLVEWHGF